ncbi:hypothetical protein [Erythrobacter sp. R86502]|uniref:hypothetical protein n=1 Tax=Erythrobacter sp. R86502 TaxID=3093846 RepID=UPI0036D343FA
MRMIGLAGAASVIGGGAWLGGAFDQGEFYPMAPTAVEARLAGLQLGPEAGDLGGPGDMRLLLRSRGPGLVRWDVMAGPQKMAQVRAHLAPEDTGTRVSITFAFTDADAIMGLGEDPLINDIARIAMEEKIDAALDGRAFDQQLMQAKLAAAVAANPGAVATMQKTLQENVAKELRSIESAPALGPGYERRTKVGQPLPPPDFSKTHADGGWGRD